MNIVDELYAVARALHEAQIAHAICGGIAVVIHGAPRATKDIDILIRADDLPRSLEAVRTVGFEFPAQLMTFHAGKPDEHRVQRVNKFADEHLMLDLLLADAGFAPMLDSRVDVELPQGKLSVVRVPDLIAMKRLAGRPQDLADIEKLEQIHGR